MSELEEENVAEKKTPISTPKQAMTPKRLCALLIVVLLVALYLITLIVAIVDQSAGMKAFGLCLFATVAIPLLAWIYIWLYGKITGKRTIADAPEEAPPAAQ